MAVKTKTRIKPLNQKARVAEWREVLVIAFSLLEEYDMKEISNLTGLHLRTIYRLHPSHGDEVSLWCRIGTLQSICAAAGMKIVVEEYSQRVRIVND